MEYSDESMNGRPCHFSRRTRTGTLAHLQGSIDRLSGDPVLKRKADDALNKIARRIAVDYGMLKSRLANSLRETW
jgi:hypothetical protein